ncbi:MAG: ZPR1 zinc finger domain-containing protein [Halobacteria archaeon]
MEFQIQDQGQCPICGSKIPLRWYFDKIPYFDEILCISSNCKCGFRYADTLILSQKEPVEYEFFVSSSDDLNTRVVRSNSGSIYIPELGVEVEPGAVAEAFISNVEGVLNRVEAVVETAKSWAETEEQKRKAEEILNKIAAIKRGEQTMTLIIKDPLGNSAIISDKARKRGLSKEEIDQLKIGITILDLQPK